MQIYDEYLAFFNVFVSGYIKYQSGQYNFPYAHNEHLNVNGYFIGTYHPVILKYFFKNHIIIYDVSKQIRSKNQETTLPILTNK